ncbi:hypothetical protein [Vibrio vulnificus]|uniref:hypothetical protein n=1 Tax=Vibrio vulnificus TaxID=672 RepID=UPI003241D8EE
MNVKLSTNDQAKLIKAYQIGYSQRKIAQALGITQARVSQIVTELGIKKGLQDLDINKL